MKILKLCTEDTEGFFNMGSCSCVSSTVVHVTEVAASSFLDITGATQDSSSFGLSPYIFNQALTSTASFEVWAPGSDKALTLFGAADTPVWIWAAANNEQHWTAGLQWWAQGCQPLILDCNSATLKISIFVHVGRLNFGSSNLYLPEYAPVSPKQNPPSPCLKHNFSNRYARSITNLFSVTS